MFEYCVKWAIVRENNWVLLPAGNTNSADSFRCVFGTFHVAGNGSSYCFHYWSDSSRHFLVPAFRCEDWIENLASIPVNAKFTGIHENLGASKYWSCCLGTVLWGFREESFMAVLGNASNWTWDFQYALIVLETDNFVAIGGIELPSINTSAFHSALSIMKQRLI